MYDAKEFIIYSKYHSPIPYQAFAWTRLSEARDVSEYGYLEWSILGVILGSIVDLYYFFAQNREESATVNTPNDEQET